MINLVYTKSIRTSDQRDLDFGQRTLEELEVSQSLSRSISPVGAAQVEGWWCEALVKVGWNVNLRDQKINETPKKPV